MSSEDGTHVNVPWCRFKVFSGSISSAAVPPTFVLASWNICSVLLIGGSSIPFSTYVLESYFLSSCIRKSSAVCLALCTAVWRCVQIVRCLAVCLHNSMSLLFANHLPSCSLHNSVSLLSAQVYATVVCPCLCHCCLQLYATVVCTTLCNCCLHNSLSSLSAQLCVTVVCTTLCHCCLHNSLYATVVCTTLCHRCLHNCMTVVCTTMCCSENTTYWCM